MPFGDKFEVRREITAQELGALLSGSGLRLHAHVGTSRTGEVSQRVSGISAGRCLSAYDHFFAKPDRGMVEVGC